MQATGVVEAGKKAGFSQDQFQRAKKALGNVETKKVGRTWVWRMLLPKSNKVTELEAKLAELGEALNQANEEDRFEESAEIKKQMDEIQDEIDKLTS
jgi:hypothetical protein